MSENAKHTWKKTYVAKEVVGGGYSIGPYYVISIGGGVVAHVFGNDFTMEELHAHADTIQSAPAQQARIDELKRMLSLKQRVKDELFSKSEQELQDMVMRQAVRIDELEEEVCELKRTLLNQEALAAALVEKSARVKRLESFYETERAGNEFLRLQIKELEADLTTLGAQVERLREALQLHEHTQACVNYSVKTAMDHGNYYCTADCTDSRRTILAETAPEDEPEKTES